MKRVNPKVHAIIDSIFDEPRLSSVLSYKNSRMLVRVLESDTKNDVLVSKVIFYEKDAFNNWSVKWVKPATNAIILDDNNVLYSSAKGQEIRLCNQENEDSLVHKACGLVMRLDANENHSACIIEKRGYDSFSRPEQLRQSETVWFDDQKASISQSRNQSARREILVLQPECKTLIIDLPIDIELTGEIKCIRDSHYLVGLTSYSNTGRCRFGFARLQADGAIIEIFFSDDIDLTNFIISPDTDSFLSLGTSIPSGDEPIFQSTYIIHSDKRIEEISPNDELWHKPISWVGKSKFLTIADHCDTRTIFLHDLDKQQKIQPFETHLSILDGLSDQSSIAFISSSLSEAPSLHTIDLNSLKINNILTSDENLNCGNAQWIEYNSPGVPASLATWVCSPTSKHSRGLVIFFHGGPIKNWVDWQWRWNPWPFVEAGYTVALIESPMSLGYGSKSMEIGWKQWRTGIADIAVKQVNAIRKSTHHSYKPLALMGGSFGGYLAFATGTQLKPDLIAAHGSPMQLDQVARSSDVGWQWIREYGNPDEMSTLYAEQSIKDIVNLKHTKVLVSHGLKDGLVSVTESINIHRSLIRLGCRSELSIFPSERHAIMKPSNLKAWSKWVLAECAKELKL